MSHRITRRRALAGLGAAGFTGLAGCSSGDQDGSDGTTTTETTTMDGDTTKTTTTKQQLSGTVKIGVLQPISGDLQYYGLQALWGFLSGLAYKGLTHTGTTSPPSDVSTGKTTMTVGDVDFELHIRDTQFSQDKAQSLATNLVTNEGVDMLFGCASSGAATRVIQTVATQAQVPYMVGPAASASITADSETCSDIVFRASENTAMDARSGGKYVAQETDVSKVYLFGADYSFGKAVVNNYQSVLENEGVEIVGKKFVPRGYKEWDGLLDNAASAGAEGIVGGFTVATLPALFTSFLNGGYDYRVFGGFATEITNSIVGQTLQKSLGKPLTKEKLAQTKLGPFTTRYHWNQYDNEINSAFVDMYTKAYGKVPDLFTSGTFTGASAIVQAVRESGSTEGADIAEALRGMTVQDTPKGQGGYTFQEYNNQARSAMTVANGVPTQSQWSDLWGAPIQPGEPLARISGDKTTIPKDSSEMNCGL